MFRSCLWCVVLPFLLTPAAAAAQAPGKGADACTIVAKAEIEQALGLKLKDGTQKPLVQDPGVLSTCDFAADGGGQVSVLLRRTTGPKYVPGAEKAEFEKQGMKLRYLEGLGTTAAFIDMSGTGEALMVYRGDYDYLQVSATNTSVDKNALAARLEKVARLALERWK